MRVVCTCAGGGGDLVLLPRASGVKSREVEYAKYHMEH